VGASSKRSDASARCQGAGPITADRGDLTPRLFHARGNVGRGIAAPRPRWRRAISGPMVRGGFPGTAKRRDRSFTLHHEVRVAVLALEGQPVREHRSEEDPERIEVRERLDLLAARLLRRHPRCVPIDRATRGQSAPLASRRALSRWTSSVVEGARSSAAIGSLGTCDGKRWCRWAVVDAINASGTSAPGFGRSRRRRAGSGPTWP